jgi:hypothetical protein
MGLLSQCHRLNLQDWDLGDGAAAIIAAKLVDEFTASFAIILTTVSFEIEPVIWPVRPRAVRIANGPYGDGSSERLTFCLGLVEAQPGLQPSRV